MTGHADITGNRSLAARARDVARHAARGSTERKAALCAAVALDESRSVRGALSLLDDLDDPHIAQAAADLLDQLATEE